MDGRYLFRLAEARKALSGRSRGADAARRSRPGQMCYMLYIIRRPFR